MTMRHPPFWDYPFDTRGKWAVLARRGATFLWAAGQTSVTSIVGSPQAGGCHRWRKIEYPSAVPVKFCKLVSR